MAACGTVLITGASGRIGRALAPRLAAAGWTLRLTDRAAPPPDLAGPFTAADFTQAGAMSGLCDGADAVVHLGGHPNTRSWDEAERINVRGTRHVLDAAVAAQVGRFVYASSIHTVGMHPADARLADDLPVRPDGAYGHSKASAELMLRHHCDRYGLRGFALRICSFRPAPTNARELRTWISPDDLARLVVACLTTDASGYRALWGVSANSRIAVDRAGWNRVGYRPRDDAEAHAPALRAAGVDTDLISEWPLLAGPFADWTHQ